MLLYITFNLILFLFQDTLVCCPPGGISSPILLGGVYHTFLTFHDMSTVHPTIMISTLTATRVSSFGSVTPLTPKDLFTSQLDLNWRKLQRPTKSNPSTREAYHRGPSLYLDRSRQVWGWVEQRYSLTREVKFLCLVSLPLWLPFRFSSHYKDPFRRHLSTEDGSLRRP